MEQVFLLLSLVCYQTQQEFSHRTADYILIMSQNVCLNHLFYIESTWNSPVLEYLWFWPSRKRK